MPPDEISAVLAASDADVVHRYLELHGERLAERLARQRLKLRIIEQVLVGRMHGKR